MGLRIRKSYNLGGGFRINVSGSGVGYSWGGKGLPRHPHGKRTHTAHRHYPRHGHQLCFRERRQLWPRPERPAAAEMALGQTEQHESADRTDYAAANMPIL